LKPFVLFLLTLWSFSTFASVEEEMDKGRSVAIKDAKERQPIIEAPAMFYKNGKMIKQVLTDNFGDLFLLPVSDFDSVVIQSMDHKRIKLRSSEISDVIFLNSKPSNTLDPIYVTGNIEPTSKFNTPFNVRSISEKEIALKGAVTLNDALKNENNVRVIQDPVLGTRISILGMQAKDVKILMDGVPIIGKQDGSVDMSQVNMANIAKIEIVDGALAVIYGTNTNGGVINLITKRKTEGSWNLSLNSYNESVRQFNQNATGGFKYKKSDFIVTVGRNVFLGWDAKIDSFKYMTQPQRDYTWNPKEQYFFNYSHAFPMGRHHSIRYKVDLFNERILNRHNPTSIYTVEALDDWYHTKRYNFNLAYHGRISSTLSLESNMAYLMYQRTFSENFKQLDLGTVKQLQTTNDYLYTVFERSWLTYSQADKKLKFLVGYELNANNAKGIRIKDTIQQITDVGMMTSLCFQPNDYIYIQPGLRYTVNNKFVTPLSPSINIKINAENNISLRFAYTKAFVAPDIKELYFEFRDFNHNINGNPNLKVETSDNIQAGLEVKSRVARKYSYNSSLNVLYNDKKDAIEMVMINKNNNEFLYKNIGRIKTLTSTLNVNILSEDYKISLGAALSGTSRVYNVENIDNNAKFFYSPEFNANLVYTHPKSQITFSFFNKYNGVSAYANINQLTRQIETTTQQSYFISDITASKSFMKDRLNINIGAKNLQDVKNISQTGTGGAVHSPTSTIPMFWGRSFFINMKFDIKSKLKSEEPIVQNLNKN
jgi:outer membrane receptor for ferrienterochelin and colicins